MWIKLHWCQSNFMILTLLMKYCQEWSFYLAYIYNSFIFNSFLTFLFPLTFICVFIRFKLVLGHLRGRIEELYMSGKTFFSWHAEEPNVAKQLVWRIFTSRSGTYCIYICCFFRFDASPKKFFVSCYYHVLFVCLAPMVFKVNTANIQYFWIFLDIQITQDPLHTAVLTTIFFSWLLLPETWLIFSFVGS